MTELSALGETLTSKRKLALSKQRSSFLRTSGSGGSSFRSLVVAAKLNKSAAGRRSSISREHSASISRESSLAESSLDRNATPPSAKSRLAGAVSKVMLQNMREMKHEETGEDLKAQESS